MSQPEDWGVPEVGPVTPQAFAERINGSLNGLLSSHRGSSRPAYATGGTFWVDSSATPWLLYFYDGTNDILMGRVNASGHTAMLDAVPQPYRRNLLWDAEGRSNQKANTTATDGAYGHDMWYALTQTAAIGVSTLTDVADGIPSMIRLTQTQASAQRMGYAQVLRAAECKWMRGGNATLSGLIRSSSSQAFNYAILGWSGTADTVTKDVVDDWEDATYTAGNFFVGSDVEVLGVGTVTPSANTVTAIPALTAALGSTFNNIIVFVWSAETMAQNETLDFLFQLEQGSYATTLERRDDRGLIRWKKFRRIIGQSLRVSTGRAESTTVAHFVLEYMDMEDTPAITFGGSAFGIATVGSDPTIAADKMSTGVAIGRDRTLLIGTVDAATLTAGQGLILYFNDNSTYIDIDSRL